MCDQMHVSRLVQVHHVRTVMTSLAKISLKKSVGYRLHCGIYRTRYKLCLFPIRHNRAHLVDCDQNGENIA